MKIGFIGLGIMGRPMAGHLQAAGHAIYSCANRTPMPEELREGGAIACATPAAVAAEVDCLILMLPDTPDVAPPDACSPRRVAPASTTLSSRSGQQSARQDRGRHELHRPDRHARFCGEA